MVSFGTFGAGSAILIILGSLSAGVAANPYILEPNHPKKAPSYAPIQVACPSTNVSLVRRAKGLGQLELEYIGERKRRASLALDAWLKNIDIDFEFQQAPIIGLTSSGGGYRAMLTGAGVVQAMDDYDSNSTVSGLYQALTYHTGLSGGSWLLSSIAGNNFEVVSKISKNLWEKGLVKNSIYPTNVETAIEGPAIKKDMAAKAAAGLSPVTTDVWARFLAYQLLSGDAGGLAKTWSSVRKARAFKRIDVPLPIITALGIEDINGSICDAADNATQYEFTPFEFGSWDAGVESFAQIEYLGTKFENGKPIGTNCTKNFDNTGYILGTSSSKFNEECGNSLVSVISGGLEPYVKPAQLNTTTARRNLFAPYPNPFKSQLSSPKVSGSDELFLVDGGQGNQNNPIWPLLQPTRGLDVIIVNDNSADTDDNWPNGTEIIHTYKLALAAGLTRMPPMPSIDTFMKQGLYKRAAFFGCENKTYVTIIWLPNTNYTFASNVPSSQFDYPQNDTVEMIANGNMVATQGNDKDWPICLGCGIVHKNSEKMPWECKACLEKYCFKE